MTDKTRQTKRSPLGNFVMTRVYVALVLVLVCVLPAQSPATAQTDDDVLTRQSDEGATSQPQRESVLAVLLSAAHRARQADPAKAASYLNRAGELQMRLNRTEQALSSYRDAEALVNGMTGSRVYIDTQNGLAMAHSHLSKCAEAKPFVERAITLSDVSGYVAGKAQALIIRSDCEDYGDSAAALQSAEQALELRRSIGDKRGMADAYAYMSDYQIAQHKLEEATQSNQAALQIWRDLNSAAGQADALISLGFIEHRKGDMEASLSFF